MDGERNRCDASQGWVSVGVTSFLFRADWPEGRQQGRLRWETGRADRQRASREQLLPGEQAWAPHPSRPTPVNSQITETGWLLLRHCFLCAPWLILIPPAQSSIPSGKSSLTLAPWLPPRLSVPWWLFPPSTYPYLQLSVSGSRWCLSVRPWEASCRQVLVVPTCAVPSACRVGAGTGRALNEYLLNE